MVSKIFIRWNIEKFQVKFKRKLSYYTYLQLVFRSLKKFQNQPRILFKKTHKNNLHKKFFYTYFQFNKHIILNNLLSPLLRLNLRKLKKGSFISTSMLTELPVQINKMTKINFFYKKSYTQYIYKIMYLIFILKVQSKVLI